MFRDVKGYLLEKRLSIQGPIRSEGVGKSHYDEDAIFTLTASADDSGREEKSLMLLMVTRLELRESGKLSILRKSSSGIGPRRKYIFCITQNVAIN